MARQPSERILFVFPGQGSQYVGMGSDVHEAYSAARQVYEEASSLLGYDVAKVSFEGPEEDLNRTLHTQPAMLVHSIACLRALEQILTIEIQPAAAAGHSLGEYTALTVGGALPFQDALRLVNKRAELMGSLGRGSMGAIRGSREEVEAIVNRFHCEVSTVNYVRQVVVGGLADDMQLLGQYLRKNHRRSVVPLKTEGAFHTHLMTPAAEAFREHLAAAAVSAPTIPVYSNFTGAAHPEDAEHIKANLFFQLFNPVLWSTNMDAALSAGYDLLVEFGGGNVRGTDGRKRDANLYGLALKAFDRMEVEGLHLPAIDVATIEDSARRIEQLMSEPA